MRASPNWTLLNTTPIGPLVFGVSLALITPSPLLSTKYGPLTPANTLTLLAPTVITERVLLGPFVIGALIGVADFENEKSPISCTNCEIVICTDPLTLRSIRCAYGRIVNAGLAPTSVNTLSPCALPHVNGLRAALAAKSITGSSTAGVEVSLAVLMLMFNLPEIETSGMPIIAALPLPWIAV